MGKKEIPELVEALIEELKKQGMGGNICPAGLSYDQVDKIDGWTKDDGFTAEQMDGLRHFADAMNTGKRTAKKWFAIGIGVIALITLREVWMDILHWIQRHLSQ